MDGCADDDQNPLEYSPANQEMSKTGGAAEGGPKTGGTKEKGETKQSGAGSGQSEIHWWMCRSTFA